MFYAEWSKTNLMSQKDEDFTLRQRETKKKKKKQKTKQKLARVPSPALDVYTEQGLW